MNNTKSKFYDNFMPFNGDKFITEFKEFAKNHNINLLLSQLTANLPSNSITNANKFIQTVLSLPLPSKDFLIHKNKLINNIKLHHSEQKLLQNKNLIYTKYNLQTTEKITASVFKYKNGLTFLPLTTLKKLYKTTFIDAGAFFGDSAIVLNKFKPSNIISFEPNSVNFKKLQTTAINNSNMSWVLEKTALGNNKEQKQLHYISNNQNHGASLLYKSKKSKEEMVYVTTLDDYLKNNSSTIGLIKIDAEGYGLQILQGAINTIKNNYPVISCAIYHNPMEFFYIKPLLENINPSYNFLIVELNQNDALKDLTLLAY